MPHIAPEDRPEYSAALLALALKLKDKPKGHLTYVLYKLAKMYAHERRYESLSNARSCLQDAHDEFYRLILAPYEDEVRKKNGDA